MVTLEMLCNQPKGKKYATLSPSSCSPSSFHDYTAPSLIILGDVTDAKNLVFCVTMSSVSFVLICIKPVSILQIPAGGE